MDENKVEIPKEEVALPPENSKPTRSKLYPPPYLVGGNCLYMEVPGKKEMVSKLLCNFIPWITTQITLYDGESETNRIRLSGRHANGHTLREIEIDAKDFPSFNWLLEKWGADCNIGVGGSNKENIRFALQETMRFAERKVVYSVTGWQSIGGKLRYLMPGDDKINVELPGKLKEYSLKRECRTEDVSVLSDMLNGRLAKQELMFPLLAFVFLSPLNHFLRMADAETKTVLMLCGRTGTKKSTIAALMLSFFGKFTASSLPLSFRDTANSIVHNAFALKDVLTCIDDFHPAGRMEEGKLNDTAQKVMQAYGDRVGRGKLNQKSEQMNSRPPQGNAIITAEFPPNIGESGTARYLLVEMLPDMIDTDVLTQYQQKASDGILQRCMFGYIEWLATLYLSTNDEIKAFVKQLVEEFCKLRKEYTALLSRKAAYVHARIPETLANVEVGFGYFLSFLSFENVISAEEKKSYLLRFKEIMITTAVKQSISVTEDKPTLKFIRKLFALIDSGEVSMVERTVIPIEKVIGYYDNDYYYFHGQVAHKVVKRFCDDQGERFSIIATDLFKALVDEGYAEPDKDQNTKLIRCGKGQTRYLTLYRRKIDELLGTLSTSTEQSQQSHPEWTELKDDEELPF